MSALATHGLIVLGFTALGVALPSWRWMWLTMWAVCAAAPWLRVWTRRIPWAVLTTPLAAGLVTAGVRGVGAPLLLAILLTYLLVQRRLASASVEDDRVTAVLAGLMLVSSAGHTEALAFMPLCLAFAVALPVALSARPTPGMVLLHLLLSVGLFVGLPRAAGAPERRDTGRLVGFSPQVELGGMDALLDDGTPVFEATVTPPSATPIYWRGVTLDQFDGRRWISTTRPTPSQLQSGQRYPSQAVAVAVTLEDSPDGVLFTTGQLLNLEVEGALRADSQGGWFVDPGERPVRYSFISVPPFGLQEVWSSAPKDLRRWLTLPEELDPRIKALAGRVAGQGAADERVARLMTTLQADYAYSTVPLAAHDEDPLAAFLFDRRRGHCEYFASALAVMARSVEVPARVVNGFVGGDPIGPGEVGVRRRHAHSWVEVALPGRGWVAVDATPGPAVQTPATARVRAGDWWRDQVIHWGREDQAQMAVSVGELLVGPLGWARLDALWRILGLMVLLPLGWGAVLLWRRPWRPRGGRHAPVSGGRVSRLHARARRHVASMGFAVPPALPPVEAAEWLQAQAPGEPADALLALAWLHYRVALGGEGPAEHADQAKELARRAMRLAPRQARP